MERRKAELAQRPRTPVEIAKWAAARAAEREVKRVELAVRFSDAKRLVDQRRVARAVEKREARKLRRLA